MTGTFKPATDVRLRKTIRCHFQDVAEAYAHQVKPWGYRAAVWWWLGHIERNTEVDGDGRRACSLRTLMRALDHHQMAVCDFMRLHPLSTCWTTRDPHDERLLALADFILHLLWKHCSTASSAPASFPFFSLVCKKRRPKIFTRSTFTGLQHADHVMDWEIEWTDEGMAGYNYWRKRQSALTAMEPLMANLVDDDPLIKSEDGEEETSDNEGPPSLAPAVRPRSTRTASVAAPTATSSTNEGDQPAAARVTPRRGRPRPPHADEERLDVNHPEPKRRRQELPTATPQPSAERRHIGDFSNPQPARSPAPGGLATASVANVEGEREKAEMRLLDAKERKIAAQRLLIQAQDDVRKARAHLFSLPVSL